MEGPSAGIRRLSRAPVTQEGSALAEILGLDEELPEGGMRQIGRRRRENDLGIAGHVELADTSSVVPDRQPTHLDVVFGRDGHVHACRQVVVAALERDAIW